MHTIRNGVKILYEDADILVCVKPAGTASQTKRSGQQDMVSLLCNYRHGNGEEPYIGLVHRLDQPVEGILVFGKHAGSTAVLGRQLVQGDFSKVYLAVTEGYMARREGKLLDYMKKDGRRNCSAVVEKGEPQAKKAELWYQILETDESSNPVQNLVKVQLITGRHHQIRVQMAHQGTPLAGDAKYGTQAAAMGTPSAYHAESGSGALPSGKKNGAGYGLGLCAYELEFVHPVRKEAMKFEIVPSQPVFQKFGSLSKKWQGGLYGADT